MSNLFSTPSASTAAEQDSEDWQQKSADRWLPERLFADPVWTALHTEHRRFCIERGLACRYPAEVTPFAAIATPTETALCDLRNLLAPGESVWVPGEFLPPVGELSFEEELMCPQMVLPPVVLLPDPEGEMVALSQANAAEMVALTKVAFPGFFRIRTGEMGSYYGIRHGPKLVAMCGERLLLPGHPEISGLCAHPSVRGKGYAGQLIRQVVREHRRKGLISWLHVAANNHRAIAIYLRMGFVKVREIRLNRIVRRD